MATYEHAVLMQHKDQNGDMHLLYPITKAENVDGLYGDAALTGVPTAPTAATGTNTAQVATTAFVQQELEDVKKSVSDGKTAVANAITAKGVETATDATFATMAANIGAIESGGGVGLNIFTQETEPETKEGIWVETANPHQSVVVGSTKYENSFIYDGVEWEIVVDDQLTSGAFPSGYRVPLVVFDNKIYQLNTLNVSPTCMYIYDINTGLWTARYGKIGGYYNGGSVSYNVAVVYKNEIHILGGNYLGNDTTYSKDHYKYDGTSWSKVSTLPYNFRCGCAVVYNDEIHILGGNDTATRRYHYKYDGTSWSKVGTLPYDFYFGCAVVYNDEIHILGSMNSSYSKDHYKYDGTSWSKVGTLPYNFRCGCAVVYHNEIHILGGNSTPESKKHYKFDGTSWESVTPLPYEFSSGGAVVYNDQIHIVNSEKDPYRFHYRIRGKSAIESCNGTKIAIYQNPSNAASTYATNFISGVPITGENNKFPSGFDDVYYIDDSGNVEESPTYYGNGTQWIKLKN